MTTLPMEWSLEEFSVQPLLWKLIEEMVAGPERPDIKVVIGEGLVDENTELHQEATSLLEIWQDYRDETDREEKNLALNQHLKKLPEPPMMRENLKKEVKLFVELLQQKANAEGRKVSDALSDSETSIVDYVMEDKSNQRPLSAYSRPSTSSTGRSSTSSSRPSTARSSQDGRQTPMRATPQSQSSSSCTSSLSDHLESMNENLNALEVDRIAEHLRELFLDERSRLKDDIMFLQECLFEESDYRQLILASPDPEPSLKDLRELGTKLEKEVLQSAKITNNPKCKAYSLSGIKQKSLDENLLDKKSKNFPPHKPNIPHPPLSPPEHPTKTTKPARSFSMSSSTSSPSPPGSASNRNLIPSPPNSAKKQRPSTAQRFRRLVLDCRDTVQ